MFLNGPIDDTMASVIVAQLLFLESESLAPISLYINSPGGAVTAGLAIYDTVRNSGGSCPFTLDTLT